MDTRLDAAILHQQGAGQRIRARWSFGDLVFDKLIGPLPLAGAGIIIIGADIFIVPREQTLQARAR